MFSLRAQRRVSLFAAFMLLWGLVFPTLANVGLNKANTAWTEVCTAHGIKKIPQSPDHSHSSGHHATVGHCALCGLHGGLLGPDVPALVHGLLLQRPVAVVSIPQVVILQPVVLLSAAPRAPPFSIV